MTQATGRAKGHELIQEGYWIDSRGLQIDPNAFYEYEVIPWTEVTALWRVGLSRPKELQPLRKYNP